MGFGASEPYYHFDIPNVQLDQINNLHQATQTEEELENSDANYDSMFKHK